MFVFHESSSKACLFNFLCYFAVFSVIVMAKRIPDRWRDYDGCKWTPIKDERIISFKTPLSERYNHTTPDDGGILESERFTPNDIICGLEEKGLHLGLVIDFTFTKRYYNPQDFRRKGIVYLKMMCPGHEIPSEKDVKMFEYEVHSFLDKDRTGKLVGVHCTHGVNRTGYMVCRYLIECRGYSPEDAIQAFNEARGHPLERENYLEDLKKRTPGHGVDYKPEDKEISNRYLHRSTRQDRYSERVYDDHHHRDRPPPWQQRHEERWSSRRDIYYEPMRSVGGDRYRSDGLPRGILKPARDDYSRQTRYNDVPWDRYSYGRDSYYDNRYQDSYYDNRYRRYRNDYGPDRFGSNYREDGVPGRYNERSGNSGYEPYPNTYTYPDRKWHRDGNNR